MRFHSRYRLLEFWKNQRIMRAENLAVARFEPTVEDVTGGGAVLDLVFSDGERFAVLPLITIQPAFLLRRERTPLIWPKAARSLDYGVLSELERLILPWLQSHVLARQENGELIRTFGEDAARQTFDEARAAGFLGAGRYAGVMRAFAPYVYAARFCAGRNVGIEDPAGANGAAMLASRAASVSANLGSAARNALANRWFDTELFGTAQSRYDVAIAPQGSALSASAVRLTLDGREEDARTIDVASPVPADVLVSFDLDDAPAARTFSIRSAGELPLRRAAYPQIAPPAGGSSGKILLVMREDFERAPDADVDEARDLASRLRSEGFTVDLASPASAGAVARPDLVHVFGTADAALPDVLRRFRGEGVPIVANTGLPAWWPTAERGPSIMNAIWGHSSDDGTLEEYLDLIAQRKLRSGDADTPGAVSDVLACVDVAIAASAGEKTQVRERHGFRGEILTYRPAPASVENVPADVTTLVGTMPFVLVHAPVQWRNNLPFLAHVAAARGAALVVVGKTVDVAPLRIAARESPELFVHAIAPHASEIEALYRAARVYADVSWAPRGLSRIARAAACGCRLLLSETLYARELWPDAVTADPGSPHSIEAAFDAAWSSPQPAPRAWEGPDLFSAAVFAYAKAVEVRRPGLNSPA